MIYRQNILLLLSVLFLVFGSLFAFMKPLYSDEGYYMWAANNIWNGGVIYRDFLFHQLPVFPYACSALSSFGVSSYFVMRFSSVLFLMLLMIFVYKSIQKVTNDNKAAVFAAILLITNGIFVDWNTVVKMYALTNLLCYLSFYITIQLKFNSSLNDLMKAFLAGVLIGLASNSRITFFSCSALLFLYYGYQGYVKTGSIKPVLYYMLSIFIGIFIVSMPTLYFYVNYPDSFIYSIFKHNIFAQQIIRDEELNFVRWVKFFLMPQNLILFILMITSMFHKFRFKFLSIMFLLTLIFSNSAGYHIDEYLNSIIPFAVFIVAVNFSFFKDKIIFKKVSLAKFVIVIYIFSFILSVPFLRNYVLGRVNEPNLYSFNEMVEFEKSLNGEKIFSSWNVFTLFSNKVNDMIPNDYFYSHISSKTTDEENRKYNLPDSTKINRLIANKYYDVIIYNQNSPFALRQHRSIIENNYRLVRTYGNIQYFVK